jgi:hypothetical protein
MSEKVVKNVYRATWADGTSTETDQLYSGGYTEDDALHAHFRTTAGVKEHPVSLEWVKAVPYNG